MEHHAYFYEGPLALFDTLRVEASQLFSFTPDSPDLRHHMWEKLGIDEARELTQLASYKPTSGKALFVVGTASISSEAQQALLKLFEEPQEGVSFVLLVPFGSLIATLRSRMLPFPTALAMDSSSNLAQAKEFLSASYKTRSALITALLKDDEGERERVRAYMNQLEAVLYAKLSTSTPALKAGILEGLADIAHMRGYLGDRAPALKMLLEHLAATLPTLS